MPPVTPGTAFVTIGGGVASDVHGKNHDLHGTLGAHIDWLDIVIANGECVRASPTEHPELFAATIGGCGLTGVIAVVRLRLRRQQANAVETREFRVRDLDHFFELMADHRDKATYTVGWVDALQRGRKLGRGIFQTGEPVLSDRTGPRRGGPTVPFTFPARTLNRYSVGLFNEAYFRRVPASGRQRIMDYDTFHHPLDAISHWNRLYGRGGFYQFQCVIPDENGIDGVRALLEQVATARCRLLSRGSQNLWRRRLRPSFLPTARRDIEPRSAGAPRDARFDASARIDNTRRGWPHLPRERCNDVGGRVR